MIAKSAAMARIGNKIGAMAIRIGTIALIIPTSADIIAGTNEVNINTLKTIKAFLNPLNTFINAPPTDDIILDRLPIMVGTKDVNINTRNVLKPATRARIGFIIVAPTAFIFSPKLNNISLTKVPFIKVPKTLNAVATFLTALSALPRFNNNIPPRIPPIVPRLSFNTSEAPLKSPANTFSTTSTISWTNPMTALMPFAKASGFNMSVARPAIPARKPPVSLTLPIPLSNELDIFNKSELASSCFFMASLLSSSDLIPSCNTLN